MFSLFHRRYVVLEVIQLPENSAAGGATVKVEAGQQAKSPVKAVKEGQSGPPAAKKGQSGQREKTGRFGLIMHLVSMMRRMNKKLLLKIRVF